MRTIALPFRSSPNTKSAYIPKARFRDTVTKWTPAKQAFDQSIVEPWGPIGLVHDYSHAEDEEKSVMLQEIHKVTLTGQPERVY